MPHSTSESFAPKHWWQSATVYQIYPASFKDSNGDGFGDIPGVISKVDYIANLGVDAVWLSPCYESPYVDMGYDISDYRKIDPRFGCVEDIETLVQKLEERNIKLLMDLVVNHTSDQHAWFLDSRSSLTSAKRDWYIWRKGKTEIKDGKVIRMPPNNWESLFKGSAWQYDELTDEYYLRLFAKEQPDLNWENPEVRKAVYADMRFWLDKHIGGFRMDVINMISKPPGLPDAPITVPNSAFQPAADLYCNGPRIHEFLQELRSEVLDHYEDLMTVGEAPFTDEESLVRKYVEPARKELCMLFQFDIFGIDTGKDGKFSPSGWQLKDLKATIAKWQQALSFSTGAWQTVFLESHDAARSVSRFGDRKPENRFKVAKMLAMLETTLSGTLFMHQGQEIGMANYADDIPIDDYQDIETKGFLRDLWELRQAAQPDRIVELDEIIEEAGPEVRQKARDHGRMPMPWDASQPHAGFSDGKAPWARLNTDYELCNVAHQEKLSNSVLKFWRKMLAFRREHSDVLIRGDFTLVSLDNGPIFAYHKTSPIEHAPGKDSLLVALNLTNETNVTFTLPMSASGTSTIYSIAECSRTKKDKHAIGQKYQTGEKLELRQYEGIVFSYE